MEKKNSAGLRIWHWANALTVLGILLTVLLRQTVLSKRTLAGILSSELDARVPAQTIKTLAATIRNQVWDFHYLFGYILCGLLVLRILVAIFDRECPMTSAYRAFQNALKKSSPWNDKHEALVKSAHASFYLILFFMACSGLIMHFSDSFKLSDKLLDGIHEIHELILWYFVFFIFSHILGVVIAELSNDRGIVSRLIHGMKENKYPENTLSD